MVLIVCEKAKKNLDKAMSACVRHTLAFLIDTKQPIYPLSIECYNDMIKERIVKDDFNFITSSLQSN